ncbi:MAG TPA: maleylpyruvate isomerase family mycothiol-dependent enzyme [Acidimicrobiales bacterium]|nr:maleylpyruvate isomerase family mycothiol-dependent enzyme [Acidimicrobiales bacterium]
MTTTTTGSTSPLPAPIGHREAAVLAEAAYARFADAVAALGPADWSRPTDCEGWTVRDLVGHVVGAMRSAASVRELARQQLEVRRRHKKTGGGPVDIMTALQVELTAGLTTDELVAECRALVRPAMLGRRRTPWPVRRFATMKVEMAPISERWRMGYLLDVILTRDAWLHRVDLSRAVGVPMALTADHDGRIVADVVAEWARRHGQPYHLTLVGPAGGVFSGGGPVPEPDRLELDAVEFCRIVSGRATGTGLLTTFVPF